MKQRTGDAIAWIIVFLGGCLIIALFVLGLLAAKRYNANISCNKMEKASGLTTHFDRQGMWSKGVCYVDVADGRSIPRELYYYEGSRP